MSSMATIAVTNVLTAHGYLNRNSEKSVPEHFHCKVKIELTIASV